MIEPHYDPARLGYRLQRYAVASPGLVSFRVWDDMYL